MILIYGNYHWGKKDCVSDRAYCSICGRANRPLRSYTAWEVGHAMFVPLMPWGRIRVVRHCLTCKQFYKYAIKGRRLKTAQQEQRDDALERVGQDIDQTLSDLASLAHLGDFEGAQLVLDQLAVRNEAEHALAEARFMGLCGDPERAERNFAKAIHLMPESSKAYFWFGQFLLIQERDEEAVTQFRCAGESDSDEGTTCLLEDFVQVRKQQKNWDGLAAVMAELARRRPDSLDNRKFAKLYSKACRKSGRVAQVVNPYRRTQ